MLNLDVGAFFCDYSISEHQYQCRQLPRPKGRCLFVRPMGLTIVDLRINETLQIPTGRVPFRGSRYIGRCSINRHRCGWNPDTSPIHRDRRDSVPRAGSDKSESSERDRPAPTGPDSRDRNRGAKVSIYFLNLL